MYYVYEQWPRFFIHVDGVDLHMSQIVAIFQHSCVTMWSRDALLSLRSVGVQLDSQVRSTLKCSHCLRRGCRAGRRVRQCAARWSVTETTTAGEIPVITSIRHLVPAVRSAGSDAYVRHHWKSIVDAPPFWFWTTASTITTSGTSSRTYQRRPAHYTENCYSGYPYSCHPNVVRIKRRCSVEAWRSRPPSGGSEELQRVRRRHYRDAFQAQAHRQHHRNRLIHRISTRQRRPTGWRRRAIRTLINSVSLLVFNSRRQPSLRAALGLGTCRHQSLRCRALSPTAASLYTPADLLAHIEACVAEISHDYPSADIILAGDLNQLRDDDLIERTGLTQVVSQPTLDASLLDQIFYFRTATYHVVRVVTSVVKSGHKISKAKSSDIAIECQNYFGFYTISTLIR